MSTTDFTAWESTWPELPARTRLYNLEPIGLGTPFVESLTSYITRSAAEHQVAPCIIISQDIAPISRRSSIDKKGHTELFKKSSISINGLSDTALEVANAMEQLTGRPGLSELTMLRWRSVLPPTGLVRAYQAWCPICFEEWRIKGKPLYEPLMWSLKETDICINHFVPLETNCPKCDRPHRPLTWHSEHGYCPWCHSWLGQKEFKGYRSNPFASFDDWDRFKSFGVAHLVGVRPVQIEAGASETFSRNICFLCDHWFKGNASELACVIHHCRYTIKRWSAGEQLPQLLSVLFLSFRFNLLPQDLFFVELSDGHPIQIRDCSFQTMGRVKRTKRRANRTGVRNYLQLTLDANIDPPPSFRRICARRRIDQGHTANAFPDLARALMDRYSRYVAERKAERRAKIVAALRKTILEVKANGQFPSRWRMRKRLPNPNWMAEKWVRIEWRRMVKEMGFVFRDN